jgi:hypothetical protein
MTALQKLKKLVNARTIKEIINTFNEIDREKWRCPECGELRIDDPRVKAGMKCDIARAM